jgi:hypothetical protein
MSDQNKVMEMWNEIKTVVQDLELDVVKNANGTAAAGIRARKGLRTLKTLSHQLVKLTTELDKANKAAKASKDAE